MPASWGPTRERQFKHIVTSCLSKHQSPCKTKKCVERRRKNCRRIAGATVNKTRTAQCETKAGCLPPFNRH